MQKDSEAGASPHQGSDTESAREPGSPQHPVQASSKIQESPTGTDLVSSKGQFVDADYAVSQAEDGNGSTTPLDVQLSSGQQHTNPTAKTTKGTAERSITREAMMKEDGVVAKNVQEREHDTNETLPSDVGKDYNDEPASVSKMSPQTTKDSERDDQPVRDSVPEPESAEPKPAAENIRNDVLTKVQAMEEVNQDEIADVPPYLAEKPPNADRDDQENLHCSDKDDSPVTESRVPRASEAEDDSSMTNAKCNRRSENGQNEDITQSLNGPRSMKVEQACIWSETAEESTGNTYSSSSEPRTGQIIIQKRSDAYEHRQYPEDSSIPEARSTSRLSGNGSLDADVDEGDATASVHSSLVSPNTSDRPEENLHFLAAATSWPAEARDNTENSSAKDSRTCSPSRRFSQKLKHESVSTRDELYAVASFGAAPGPKATPSHGSEDTATAGLETIHRRKRPTEQKKHLTMAARIPAPVTSLKLAKNPREAVAVLVDNYLQTRRKTSQKRPLAAHTQDTPRKAQRRTHEDDATGSLDDQDESEEEVHSDSEPHDGKDDISIEETNDDAPLRIDTLDFDVKRGVSQRRVSAMKTIKGVFGNGNAVEHENGGLVIQNMVSPLWPQQALAVHWMVLQEEIAVGPRGGILAADMGTGKTVMSLGIITGNPPLEDDVLEYSQATLVVVPNQKVARQWLEKIREHCKGVFAASCIAVESQKLRSPWFYEQRNIVITTYSEIAKEKLSSATLRDLNRNWNDPDWRKKVKTATSQSPLFYVNWYRIILDEAHKISNKTTLTFRSCRELKAKYRWCLSGTPLSNTDEELYPYLSFLACDFAKSTTTFTNKFKIEEEEHKKGKKGSRPHLDALMQLILYRYKLGKTVAVGGSQDISVPMSVEEDLVFQEVKPILSKKPSKLQRKRQAVSHFFNLERMFDNDFNGLEIASLLEKFKDLEDRCSVMDVVKTKAEDPAVMEVYSVGFERLLNADCASLTGAFHFEPLLRMIEKDQRIRHSHCTSCKKVPKPWNWVRSKNCNHLYCSRCLPSNKTELPNCPREDCDAPLAWNGWYSTFSRLSTIASGNEFRPKGADVNGTQLVKPSDENPANLLSDLGNIQTPPSTKLVMAAAIILTWRQEHPEDKIVVFLDFLTSAKVLGTMLSKAGERFLYVFGHIGDQKGQAALAKFKDKTAGVGVPILIAGLRSCGEALNLTEANRVITVDLWWNNSKEQQAFGRVHRIGQEKETHFVRLVSEGDRRIMEMQRKKLQEINYAMNEDGHKIKRLQAKELNELFEEDLEPPEEDQDSTTDEEDVDGEETSIDEDRASLLTLADVADAMDTTSAAQNTTDDDLSMVGGDGAGDAQTAKTGKDEMPGFWGAEDGGYGQQDAVMEGYFME
ncbi:hypothetical protein NLU13_5897 [Sarocladium strictum]|uniref:Uncharacterized protein n=1 Tax=Sarocladium strictum TaxID=5046 RepID=A0AA39L6S0_SARSR|nr:hypothetical protein NLU13_5897 [Sarocladium strictum]